MDATASSHRPPGQHVIYLNQDNSAASGRFPSPGGVFGKSWAHNRLYTSCCWFVCLRAGFKNIQGTSFLGMQLVRWWSSEMSVTPEDVSKSVVQNKGALRTTTSILACMMLVRPWPLISQGVCSDMLDLL